MTYLRLPPELLLLVMKQVDRGEEYPASQQSLRNAILVNHEWAEAGSHILWKSPPAAALAAIAPDRRQYYANKIIDLCFDDVNEGKLHATFKNLSFPRLKTTYIERVKLKKHEKLYLAQYMQPQVWAFYFMGGGFCENALTTLASGCPALEEITFDDPIEAYNKDRYLEFLKNCKSLGSICLGHGWTELLTSELFAGLADHEILYRLDIRPLVEDYTIQEALSMISNPFCNLQNLHLRLESQFVARLASVATSLTVLFLIIEDSEHDALAGLGPLSNIVHLELTYLDDTELSPQGFRALESMQGLKTLLLESRGALLDAIWMDDSLFAEFTSKLPNLTSLDLQLDSDITIEALTSLATSHPKMDSFDIFGEFDLSDWARLTQPLFPNLTRFVIERPMFEGRTRRYVSKFFLPQVHAALNYRRASSATPNQRASQIAGLLLRHCPRLEQLCFHAHEYDELAQLVVSAIGARVDGHFSESLLTWFRTFEHSYKRVFHPSETRIYDDDW